MTLCIGQHHPITIYRTVFWLCVVLVLSVIRCSCYLFLDIILFYRDFHHDSFDYHWDFHGHSFFIYTLGFLYPFNFLDVSAPGHSDYGQLVTKTTRIQDNSYPRQLVPRDNSYPRLPVPKTTRTQDNSYPTVWLLQYKRR